ncbi:hypothetical protein llap_16605 [Limosa lapponica baueri]|uniref:Uncharacterized protein n=1 Tax=Limosa lapponica baueri TaxID=1758121 RepID=A0A2I0TH19_LIMLA|nr:hypothetical protein llap_16605 [Limosa lapponica baueri]
MPGTLPGALANATHRQSVWEPRRGKFAGRGECFFGDRADHLRDIPPSFSRRAIHTQTWHIHLAQDHRISPSPDFSS